MDADPSPRRVYERVKRDLPGVSRATIYRNLHALTTAGLLSDRLGISRARYEVNSRPHGRFICLGCGQTLDLPGVAKAVDVPAGFEVVGQRVELYGRCPSCATAVAG